MRQSGNLKYPDATWFAWMPCLFALDSPSADGLEVSMTCNGVTKTVEHDAFSGCAYVDMREYVQGFFSLVDALSYATAAKGAHAIVVTYTVRSRSGSTYTSLLSNANSLFVWGYLDAGEIWNERRKYRWFKNFPFFVDVYAPSSKTCTISGGGASASASLTSKGLWHVPLSAATFATASMVTLVCDSRTYMVDVDDCADGVYMRWLDRHGRVCHWLFRKSADTRDVKSTSYFRPNLAAIDDNYWSGWNGHRDMKTRQRRLTIGYPFVDSDTYEMMSDLASSPFVEMMLPTEDWISVRIEDGTWKKSRAVLQEFECTVVMDEVTEA